MKGLIKILKDWKSVTQQKIGFFFLQLLTASLHVGLKTLPTIFSAMTITKITQGDYKGAVIWLIIDTVSMLARYLCYDLNYRTAAWGHRVTLKSLHNRLYPKIINVKKSEKDTATKEFVMNTVVNDADVVSFFFDTLATRFSNLVQVFITLGIVMFINVWAGFAILCLGVVDAVVINWINGKLAKVKKDKYACSDQMYQNIISLSEGRTTIKDLNAEHYFKKSFDEKCQDWSKINNRSWHWNSIRDNGLPAFYNLIISIMALGMILLISKGSLSLTLYLIIVPYLTTCTEKLNSFFHLTKELKEIDVSLQRLKVIFNFNDKELASFGKMKMTGNETLQFVNVSADKVDADTTAVHDLSFSITAGNTVVFKGNKQCGKRTIFRLLRRKILPTDGKILLDQTPYSEYSCKTFKTNLNYVTAKPYYFPGTIISNMKIVENSTKRIYEYCKKLGIYDYILSLPDGFKTEISQNDFPLPKDKLFLLGLVRTLLTNSKIIIIYELPPTLTQPEKENMVQQISSLKGDKTLIIFTHDPVFDKIADNVYQIEDGRIIQ